MRETASTPRPLATDSGQPQSSAGDRVRAAFARPDFVERCFDAYSVLRVEAPVWTTPTGYTVFSRYDDCHEILREWERFRQPEFPHPSFISMNPPDHTRLRRVVARGFTPAAVTKLRDQLATVSGQLIDTVVEDEQMDFVARYAAPLPTIMITDMLGVPVTDGRIWESWAWAIHRSFAAPEYLPEQQREAERLHAEGLVASAEETLYFRGLIAARQSQRGSDLISLLMEEQAGERLTEEELLYTLVLILGGGHHTSVSLLASSLYLLLKHPAAMEIARTQPEALPRIVDEVLRVAPVTQVIKRVAHHDTEVGGCPLKAGGKVMALIAAANRDPDVFRDPDRFDVTRANANKHLSFGTGVHHCLGAHLARTEAVVALQTLLSRLSGLRLVSEPEHDGLYNLRGLAGLHIAWDAPRAPGVPADHLELA